MSGTYESIAKSNRVPFENIIAQCILAVIDALNENDAKRVMRTVQTLAIIAAREKVEVSGKDHLNTKIDSYMTNTLMDDDAIRNTAQSSNETYADVAIREYEKFFKYILSQVEYAGLLFFTTRQITGSEFQ